MSVYTIGEILSRAAERRADGRTYTGRLVTVDAVHHEVHEGKHFFINNSTANASATEVLGTLITTPATKRIHMVSEFGGSAATVFTLIEGPTVVNTSKSALVEFNNDRESADTATVVAVDISDTDISIGTTMIKTVLGGGLQGRTGGNLAGRSELLLAQGEDYYFQINSDGANNNVAITVSWYEVSS